MFRILFLSIFFHEPIVGLKIIFSFLAEWWVALQLVSICLFMLRLGIFSRNLASDFSVNASEKLGLI